ncbi:DUF192 domain-containing protein [Eggerthellaceae bacterium zg-1084]|uniref:DUF192 domain-containing protein n=1 Tax=Berryella wangjianweii TaxID=2734634 RepID=UPI001553B3DB|nr:DUF192 domain-containing protein [Berryella wangjianweii]NPD30719.1 DUF192 domain-containing protein [Berryella wangjianweii]
MEPLTVASGVAERLRGLLGQRACGGVLMLTPCWDIHTFGMTCDLDVAFVSREGVVLASHREVRPRSRLRCRGARSVLERIASRREPWFTAGDRLALTGSEVDVREHALRESPTASVDTDGVDMRTDSADRDIAVAHGGDSHKAVGPCGSRLARARCAAERALAAEGGWR